jgi:nucleoside-diphosphate-sugar epimerase
MNKISVFGGGGFIGGNYATRYADEVEVVQRDFVISEHPDILDFVSTVDNYNVKTNPYLDIETNLILLIDKLEKARQFHGSKTVYNFVSSWFIYGKTTPPAKEDSPCFPTGFYSVSKLCAEQLLASYCLSFGMKYRILRLGNVIGIGDKKISPRKNALQWMVRELAQGREISLYKNGAVRDIIDIRDVVSAINLVVRNGGTNQVYNVANGQGLNVEWLVSLAWHCAGYTGKINHIEVPEFHKIVQTPIMFLDISKIKELGYVQQYDIKQTIASLVDYYKKNE